MKYSIGQIFKKAWSNRYNIFVGIFNWIFNLNTKEAKRRMSICKNCEQFDTTGESCCIPNTQPCCKICGCKLTWKVRAKDEPCDLKKW